MKSEETKTTESVLIVDDDPRVVELLQITLSGRGYQVHTAYDGEAALQAAHSRKPDCVVLDVRLPRKSGFEVLDTIRRDPDMSQLPVILISGDAATETRLQGLKLGADDFLTKPFSPRELIIKLRRILDRSQDHQLLVLKAEVLGEEVRRGRDTLLQMRHELSQKLNRMGAMLSQVVELSQHHSIETVLERFVLTTAANLEFERIALCVGESDGSFAPRAWRGMGEAAPDLRLSGQGPVARMGLRLRRPVRVDEFEDQPEAFEEVLKLSAAGMSLVVPALSESRLHALLLLGERSSHQFAGIFDYKLLEILAGSIVAALQNAEAFERTQRSFLDTTVSLITNLEERYPFLRGHSARVAETALAIGRALDLSEEELESLRYGALLHDLGQLELNAPSLEEPVILSPSDRRLRRRRAAEQAAVLLGPGRQGLVGEIVRHHLEYWDGSGFPDGLREREIPLGARIVALANSWDALIHDRPHRKAYSPEEALRIVRERAARQFDPELIPHLVRLSGVTAAETEPSRT